MLLPLPHSLCSRRRAPPPVRSSSGIGGDGYKQTHTNTQQHHTRTFDGAVLVPHCYCCCGAPFCCCRCEWRGCLGFASPTVVVNGRRGSSTTVPPLMFVFAKGTQNNGPRRRQRQKPNANTHNIPSERGVCVSRAQPARR